MKLYLIRHGDAEYSTNDTCPAISARRAGAKKCRALPPENGFKIGFHLPQHLAQKPRNGGTHRPNTQCRRAPQRRDGLRPEGRLPVLCRGAADRTAERGDHRSSSLFTHSRLRVALKLPGTAADQIHRGSVLCLEREGYGEWLLRSFTPAKIIAKLNG